jgi:hypothetical protein
MDDEMREVIGRALYEASFDFDLGDMPTWDELLEKEEWRARAEKVVRAHEQWTSENVKGYLRTADIDVDEPDVW